MPTLVDSHLHLDDTRFDADRRQVIERARHHGVRSMVVPAIHRRSWDAIATLSHDHTDVFPAYGLHPMFQAEHRPEHLDALSGWLAAHPAVAVGEIGLDFFVEGVDHESQQRYFSRQLAIASEHGLPVIIHARRAVEEVILAVRRQPGLRGVVHSFSGSPEQARQLFDLGFLLGLGGPLTYPGAHRLHRLVTGMPLDQLLLESDAPDQPGVEHRGQRNEPAWVRDTLAHVARLRNGDEAAIAAATSANAERLFQLQAYRDSRT
jgi:TatD DNase family protein